VDLTPFLPQIITAAASLGGVLIGLLINGRREDGRFEKQLAFEREKLLADERRLLFIKTAHAFQRTREHLTYRDEEQLEHGRDDWERAVTKSVDTLFIIETELRILAPDIAY
jgi:hypothetical protein